MSPFWATVIGSALLVNGAAAASLVTPQSSPAPSPSSAILISASMQTHEVYLVGYLRISHPTILMGQEDGTTASAVFTVENRGSTADRLVAATIDAVALSDFAFGPNGGAAMEIPAGARVDLTPPAMHLPLDGPHGPLKDGDRLHGSLRFERAGSIPVDFTVQSAP
ncbi:copper chaperone PCu(A)C [Lichenihabitans sp. PAMC28606]|uniref:copper chaperone PCu(A)C n=1 Tax=Lichenihabitans sp. PAMC28606 TaxID=2880932 RepID=UPI001D0AAEA2|nr:copper chaperone PCu(A)C [Lichenihabitans sp. PAMC28606]UDL94844.1 copper chaperone PCu(A)C [Lichenihabitans sp. PAMC28606]